VTAVTPEELALWSRYVQAVCGVSLDGTKGYLIETRLGGLLRETGCSSFTDLHRVVSADATNGLRRRVVDSITTGETSFFRDTAPFDLLRYKLLPELIDRRRKRAGASGVPLRIWSAGCATGQEVYSTAIVAKELLGDSKGYDVRILGTDVSDRAIAVASLGKYTRLETERGLTPDLLGAHFAQHDGGWKVRDEIRALATFRTLNLLDPLPAPMMHDLILCRNVGIYFSDTDRTRLYQRLADVLAPDGFLVIGSTESLTGLCPRFEPKRYLRSVFYELRAAGQG
jgi:chemotaxis protein methyltransferase CheR